MVEMVTFDIGACAGLEEEVVVLVRADKGVSEYFHLVCPRHHCHYLLL